SSLCRACLKHMELLEQRPWRGAATYRAMLKQVGKAIGRVEPAVRSNDTRLAMKIGRIKPELDRSYNGLLDKYMKGLEKGRHTKDLVTGLLMAHGVDQMGEALLDISEAIISANFGQPMNIDQYHSLRASLEHLDEVDDPSSLVVKRLAETRSGSGISGIGRPNRRADDFVAVYKDGRRRKLREERRGLKGWEQKFPGLTPRILDYRKRGESASLLIEHLTGLTFEQVLLHESSELLAETLERLNETMARVWQETRSGKPVAAGFMRQLSRRLEEVYRIHPEFRQGECRICGETVPSFGALLKRAHAREAEISPPFSVYIHGDFNVDNIIYDPVDRKISFIDLHRSRYLDYVQDISVFMVSNYRLQVFDARMRRRILELVYDFYRFASRYARKSGDETFELRLALGLARSFATSTRFILDKSLAGAMFMRSRYLIERVLATAPAEAGSFRIPVREIFVG
ncbi:MAG: aminoglycoside phosphotransferase family protein, partial [Thiohalobacterales bacterium]|nr:aminoglycoside phosphotransferase family protein [Thiohalobacterales bacterium]